MTTRNQWWATGLVWIGVTLASCGGHTDPREAMKAKDYADAVKLYEEQLAKAKPVEDAWFGAAIGRIKALAHMDKARAGTEANALVAQHGQALGEKKVGDVARALKDGGAFKEALTLLNDTVKTWPVSKILDGEHDQVFADALAKGNKDDLASLGYTGGGEKKYVPRQGSQTPQ